MSIKLKDTIYDLINKANKDGSGNTITSTYLKLSGGMLTGDLGIKIGDTDKFVAFDYDGDWTAGASWRIGVKGSGSSNTNYFSLQSGTSSTSITTWTDVFNVGQNDFVVYFNQIPKVNNTAISLEGHTHSQYLTSLPSHNHNGSYLSLSNTQTPVVTNSQQGIVNFKSTDTSQAGIRIFQGDTNKGGLWWISGYGMVIYSNSPSNGAYLGILDNGTPHFNKNTLLHAGNYTSYCATSGHTHNYAGSSYSGGAATSANKLNSIELSSGSLGSYYTEVNNYYAGGSNAVTDKPSGVDAFGVLNLRTAQGWWGQVMISSNLATGMYWRTGTSLSGGWRTVIDTSNYTTWCATSGHTHSGYAASNHTHSNYSTTDHTHSNYYDYNVSRTANTVLAAPNGAAGSASFRKLVAADLPSHNHSASNITSGTLAVARGGTGQTTLNDACNALINSLTTGTSNPVDSDYYVAQYAGGGTTTTSYHRRPVSALYNYIKGKLDSVYAPSSHSHSYLPLSGGTITSTSYGPLTIYRSGSSNMAAIMFKNSLGNLGSIGMNAVSGSLFKYDSTTSSYVTMIDSGNYTTWCAKKDHSHTITHAGTYWKMNDSSTNPYLQLVQGSTWYIQGYNGYLYLGAGSTNSVKIDSSGGCDVKTLYINGEKITFTT